MKTIIIKSTNYSIAVVSILQQWTTLKEFGTLMHLWRCYFDIATSIKLALDFYETHKRDVLML